MLSLARRLLASTSSRSLVATTVPRVVAAAPRRWSSAAKTAPSTPSTTTATTTTSSAPAAAAHSDDVAPLCDCLKPAAQCTVNKAGPTQGRLFWGCADFTPGQKKGCSFFKWRGDAPPLREALPAASGPDCKCGQPSVMLTVSRTGHNFGRTFYRCNNGLDKRGTLARDSCDFFQWVDPHLVDDDAATSHPPSSSSSSVQSSSPVSAASAAQASVASAAADAGRVALCGCNKPAVMLRVTKASPNIGRRFLKCADGKCGFFAWA